MPRRTYLAVAVVLIRQIDFPLECCKAVKHEAVKAAHARVLEARLTL